MALLDMALLDTALLDTALLDPPAAAAADDVPGSEARWELTASSFEDVGAGARVHLDGPGAWFLVLDGELRVETRGAAETLGPGDAAYLSRPAAHHVTARRPTRLMVASIRDVGTWQPLQEPLVARGFAAKNLGITALLELCPATTAWNLAHFGKSYGELIAAAMRKQWLELDGRHTCPPALTPELARVVTAVLREPARPWTLETLADLAHLSRSRLGEHFQASLHMSPLQFVRESRMRLARKLLADPARSVTHVAFAVGYGSVAAFSRAFTGVHGMTPRAWRSGTSPRSAAEAREPGRADDREPGTHEQDRAQARHVEQLSA